MKRTSKISTILILASSVGFYTAFRKSRPKSKAVLILGNGRSGTSVLTRALNFMGVNIGEDNFIKPKAANPKGYFENKRILEIHKKIGSKLKFRPSPEGYENDEDIQPYKKELINYIREQFLDKPVWAWKDPRTNDYLALWKDILRKLNVEPHHVIIIRNPIDVVASNKNAWNRDEEWALRQWQIRTLFSLRDTFGDKRIIVSYEELFDDSLECLRRISKTLNLPWPEDETKLKRQLDSFIEPDLQRSNSGTTLDEFVNREDVNQDVKDLYVLALEGTRSQEYFQSQDFHDRVKTLYQNYLSDYGPLKRNPPKNKESNTSRLGYIRLNGNIYDDFHNQSSYKKATEAHVNQVYYIKSKAKVNNNNYYLLSQKPSSVEGVVGWVHDSDLVTHYPHSTVDHKSKSFNFKGSGNAYSKAWGGFEDLVFDLSHYENKPFNVHLTEKVGNDLWYRGILNDRNVWVHSSNLSTK